MFSLFQVSLKDIHLAFKSNSVALIMLVRIMTTFNESHPLLSSPLLQLLH